VHRSFVHLLAFTVLLAAGEAHAHDLGIMLDAGVPDGANLSLAYKPWSWVRVHAGGGTNLVSPGFRTGVSLLLGGLVGTVEYGHYFEGNANGIWQTISGHPDADVPSLHELGYDYANFRLGVELGPRVFKFQLAAGMSYLTGKVKDLGATLTKAASSEGTTVTFGSDPTVSAWTVSARFGFIVYFGL
jgi:hypothetical protein